MVVRVDSATNVEEYFLTEIMTKSCTCASVGKVRFVTVVSFVTVHVVHVGFLCNGFLRELFSVKFVEVMVQDETDRVSTVRIPVRSRRYGRVVSILFVRHALHCVWFVRLGFLSMVLHTCCAASA